MALSYLIALKDGISKNAATMAGALRDLSAAMRETQREAGALGGVMVQVNAAVKGGGGVAAGATKEWTAKGLAVKAVTGYFVGLAGAAAAAGIAIGKTLVDGAAFREQQVGRFTAVLGDAGKAAITFKDSILIAEKTRFAPRAVSNTLAQLIQAVGEDNAMARETAGRLMDIVTVNGGGDEELKQALGGIRDVINKNKLMGDDLKQLMTAGVNMRVLARSIGANFKISAKDDDELVLKVQKAISHGQIRGQLAVRSINDAIANQTGKGAAGAAAFALGSSTISGLISNIKGGLETLAGLQDTSQWTGIIALKSLLQEIASLFASDSKQGSAMTGALKASASALAPIFELLAGDVKQFGAAMSAGGVSASILQSGLTMVAGTLYGIFWLVKWVTYGVLGLFGVLTKGFAVIGEFFVDAGFWLFEAGSNLVEGLINGIRSGLGALRDAIVGMGASTVGWLKETLGIHSPSRVFMQLGAFTGLGFAAGIAGSAGAVEDASVGMSDAALAGVRAAGAGAAGAGRAAGGAGGAAISITIAPTITSAASDPAAVAAEVLPRLGALVSDEVEQALERMAL